MKTRRRFSAELKAKVALEAIRGEQSISEPATKNQLHPNQITQWKRQAVEKLAKVFDDKTADAQAGREAEVTKLQAKIGQLGGEGTIDRRSAGPAEMLPPACGTREFRAVASRFRP